MWDVAISENGDIVLAGNRDLSGISGSDLTDQRIKLRLRFHRGSWFYDESGRLGSRLYQISGKRPDSSLHVDDYVREALRPMDDIVISDIEYRYDEDAKSLLVGVSYEMQSVGGGLTGEIQTTTILLT